MPDSRASGVSNSILDAVRDTPMLEIECVYCKCDY